MAEELEGTPVSVGPVQETWWHKVKAFVQRYLIAPIPVLILAIGAVLLAVLGAKNVQVGGLIAKLVGKKEGAKAIDVANSIPEGRVQKDGTLIPIGEPDSKGITQVKVVPIKTPGVFGDPSKVTITDPDTGKDLHISVPDGVKAKDVDKVVVVRPDVHVVVVKNESKVSAKEVDDLLTKYKGI